MNSDDLLEEMRVIAQEDESDLGGISNGAYDRLSDGTISADERALLQELAQDDAEAMRAFEAFAPLGESFKESATDFVLESLGRTGTEEVQNEPIELLPKESWVERLSRFFAPRMVFWGPALSLCALAVFVLSGENQDRSLPQYGFELRSSDSVLRSHSNGSAQSIAQLSEGSLLDIILRPQRVTDVDTAIRTYFIEGDLVREVNLAVSRSSSGTFRIKSVVDEKFPRREGLYQLAVIIAPAGSLPSIAQWSPHLESAPPSSPWQIFRLSFHLHVGGSVDGK